MVSEKLKTSGMFNSDFKLKIQKQNLYFAFFLTVFIHIDSAFKYTPQSQKSTYLTLVPLILVSEGV